MDPRHADAPRARSGAARLGLAPAATEVKAAAAGPGLERAFGQVTLAIGLRHGRSRVLCWREQGCAKARLPRPAGAAVEAVLMNLAGGLTDGDRFAVEIEVGTGAELTLISAAAEKIYRSRGAAALVANRLRVAAGGRLEWLPQGAILFERGRLRRRTEVELVAGACFLGIEMLALGRRAAGETLGHGFIHDVFQIRVDGQLWRHDALRLEGDLGRLLRAPALGAGAAAFATLWWVGDRPEDAVARLRAVEVGDQVRVAAGRRGPVVSARLLSCCDRSLREAAGALVAALRRLAPVGGTLRAWRC